MSYSSIIQEISELKNTSQQTDVLLAILQIFKDDTVGLWREQSHIKKDIILTLQSED